MQLFRRQVEEDDGLEFAPDLPRLTPPALAEAQLEGPVAPAARAGGSQPVVGGAGRQPDAPRARGNFCA